MRGKRGVEIPPRRRDGGGGSKGIGAQRESKVWVGVSAARGLPFTRLIHRLSSLSYSREKTKRGSLCANG